VASFDRQKAIDRIRADVSPAFGGRLVCLAVYGSAVTEAFIPPLSNVNVAIVLDHVGIDDLKALQRLLPAWHELRIATPLLIDREYLERARDVFPLEIEDLRDAHQVLAGEDVFAGLRTDPADVRRELEQEARGKLLRLRVAYAETGGDRAEIEELARESVKSFLVIMRGVLRLQAGATPAGLPALVHAFEALVDSTLPGIGRATRLRLGLEEWPAESDAAFAEYLDDVVRLVGIVDRLYAGEALR
jgi:hypothetical protein